MTTTEPPAQAIISDSARRRIIFGLLMAMFLSAVEGTIVATALPTIVGDLGGLDQFTWVITSYFVSSTIATPLLGKLSDPFGRRPIFVLSIVLFIVASALAGFSQSMLQLVVFRSLQGIGGGGLQALAFIIIGDILAPRERGRYMGYFTGTFALSGLIGPLLGGLIVDAGVLGWRWIFFLNVPLGIVTLAVVAASLRLPRTRKEVDLDWLGAALLTVGVGSLLVAASIGGDTVDWASAEIAALVALGLMATVAFVVHEFRAADPILPMRLFRNDIFAVGSALAFFTGAALMSSNIFLPLFLQVVTGSSATVSGLVLAPMMIALTVSSAIAGRRITARGRYRSLVRLGPIVAILGLVGLTTLGIDSQPWHAIIWVVLNGLGMGLLMPPLSIAIQNGVDARDLGVATSANVFFRTLGMAIGIAGYGVVMANRLRTELADRLPSDTAASLDVAELTGSPEAIRALSPDIQGPVIESVAAAVNLAYWAALPVAAVMLVLAWALREIPLRQVSPLEEVQAADSSEDSSSS